MEILVLVILALWLGLTIVHQISHQGLLAIWKRDVCSLVPRWTFFTPRPVYFDYEVFYRDAFRDGNLGPWHPLPYMRRGGRRWQEAIWDPGRRNSKVLSTLAVLVSQSRAKSRHAPETLSSSPYYRALESIVMNLPRPEAAVSRQFMILQSFGFIQKRPPVVVLVSEHRSLEG